MTQCYEEKYTKNSTTDTKTTCCTLFQEQKIENVVARLGRIMKSFSSCDHAQWNEWCDVIWNYRLWNLWFWKRTEEQERPSEFFREHSSSESKWQQQILKSLASGYLWRWSFKFWGKMWVYKWDRHCVGRRALKTIRSWRLTGAATEVCKLAGGCYEDKRSANSNSVCHEQTEPTWQRM